MAVFARPELSVASGEDDELLPSIVVEVGGGSHEGAEWMTQILTGK